MSEQAQTQVLHDSAEAPQKLNVSGDLPHEEHWLWRVPTWPPEKPASMPHHAEGVSVENNMPHDAAVDPALPLSSSRNVFWLGLKIGVPLTAALLFSEISALFVLMAFIMIWIVVPVLLDAYTILSTGKNDAER